MPKTPITILVAPSRLAGWSHGLLGVAVVAVLAYYSGAPLAMAGLAWLALSMGYLAFVPSAGICARYRSRAVVIAGTGEPRPGRPIGR